MAKMNKLPKGWNEVELGEICDVRDGTHESPKYVSEGFPLITSKNLKNGFIDFSEVNLISKKDYDNINKRSKVDVGDILMPMIGTIGNPIIVKEKREFAIKNVALIKFNNESVLNTYIRFLLNSNYFKILSAKVNRGGTQKFIALKDIRNFLIPLPPLQTQKKMVAILEKAEKTKKWRKEANGLTKDFLKSVFLEMFLKGEYPNIKINEVVKKVTKDNPIKDYPEEYFDYVDISSIDNKQGKIIDTRKVLGKEAPSRAKQKINYGDLIISTVRPNLNSVALVPNKLDQQICSTGFCVLRADNNKVVPEYLYHVARSSRFIESMMKIAKGASYPAVSDRDIKNYEISLPPIELQNKFASIVKEVEFMKEHQKQSKDQINNLFNALMQKAFKGELKC